MEKPILFKPELIGPIMKGRKTQTRRVIDPQPEYLGHSFFTWQYKKDGGSVVFRNRPDRNYVSQADKPWEEGDILWVREKWAEGKYGIIFGADNPKLSSEEVKEHTLDGRGWRSPIHMKKEYARIKLKVRRIWVERVQDISENDAMVEGVAPVPVKENDQVVPSYREGFFNKWQEIYDIDPRKVNSFVWVVQFELYDIRKEGGNNGRTG